jgi:signal transduction histidine kinase
MDFASCCGLSAEGLDAFHSILPMPASEDTASGRAVVRRAFVEIPDVEADPSYGAQGQGLAKAVTYRSIAAVPLLHEGNPIGAIAVARANAGSFPKRQIVLLQAFSDQAVIAIENVRLFDEVQARTRDLTESLQQQTATADVLKVISRSTFDLQVVLDTLVESAARLCEADSASIHRPVGGSYPYVASYGLTREYDKYMRERPLVPGRGTVLGRAITELKPIQIDDVTADPEYTLIEARKIGGFRTVLGVPLLREGAPIGIIMLTRNMVRPFTDKQIELVSTFADQAAIAIENVRLFESVEARTRELAKSLKELRTTQDRLVQTQKLASLGQLTAGIAHEIKNPLNFVNNFSGVSAELVDELREALKDVSLNEKRRGEISELMDTLRGNLERVVQHGKRADAIVKNMLLHSREGSGEHRPVDVNALVEESLNLAYHGARAEKQGFNITVKKSFDPSAGQADMFPQDITRVLLNLISNGFYAALKRNEQVNGGNYEPTLTASTRNLDDSVEIRIRDNGTGISPDVKEKMFNPFFTTKPAGEGTGLGLSICHDIVVKQHAGSIEVDTEPGEFTEIKLILPRAAV